MTRTSTMTVLSALFGAMSLTVFWLWLVSLTYDDLGDAFRGPEVTVGVVLLVAGLLGGRELGRWYQRRRLSQ